MPPPRSRNLKKNSQLRMPGLFTSKKLPEKEQRTLVGWGKNALATCGSGLLYTLGSDDWFLPHRSFSAIRLICAEIDRGKQKTWKWVSKQRAELPLDLIGTHPRKKGIPRRLRKQCRSSAVRKGPGALLHRKKTGRECWGTLASCWGKSVQVLITSVMPGRRLAQPAGAQWFRGGGEGVCSNAPSGWVRLARLECRRSRWSDLGGSRLRPWMYWLWTVSAGWGAPSHPLGLKATRTLLACWPNDATVVARGVSSDGRSSLTPSP